MLNIILFLFCSFLFSSNEVLFSVGDYHIYQYDFFQQIGHGEWSALDSLKRVDFSNSFLEKELSYYESLSMGLGLFPENYIKLQDRRRQLLINNTYERLVAHPLIPSSDFLLAKKHLGSKVFAHHVLVGFDGCKLPGSFTRNKEEALVHALSLQKNLSSILKESPPDSSSSVFSEFAFINSEDPSVKNNRGEIGWVSWGRVMPSFQEVAFSLNLFSVSSPVLTDYGYHLIFITKQGPSDYSFYNPVVFDGLSKKICLQNLSFDSLKLESQAFDSLLLYEGNLTINTSLVSEMFALVEKKKKENQRGNKNAYLSWFEEEGFQDVLFVFNNKGFGVGWFLYYLKKTPPTRVPSIRAPEDIVSLLKSFLLQKSAFDLGIENGFHLSGFFQQEFLNHKKNILKNEYVSGLLNSVSLPDSADVKKAYSSGVFNGDYIKPRSVVFSEIKFSSKEKIEEAYSFFVSSGDFDATLSAFGGKIKSPVTLGRGGPLSSTAFEMSVGEISPVIENTNKTFSIIRVEKFLEEEPFTINNVYSQIERKIKKEKQDSIKKNLSVNLQNKYNIQASSLW